MSRDDVKFISSHLRILGISVLMNMVLYFNDIDCVATTVPTDNNNDNIEY